MKNKLYRFLFVVLVSITLLFCSPTYASHDDFEPHENESIRMIVDDWVQPVATVDQACRCPCAS